MKSTKPRAMAVLMILLISLCAMTSALSDTPWDLRAALTRVQPQGEPIVNESLLQTAQPVNQTFSGEYVSITVSDALFDGKSLIVAWQTQNLSDGQLVYLFGMVAKESANWYQSQMIGGPTEEFVLPGQTRNEWMDCEIVEPIQEDTMRVGIHYFVLAPTEETALLTYPDPKEQGYAEKQELFDAEAAGYIDAGKMLIVKSSEGQPRFLDTGPSFYDEMNDQFATLGDDATQVDAMLATGRMKLLEEIIVSFDLKVEHQPLSMLADGVPVEKEYDGFTTRITRADYTACTMQIILEIVFPDEESAISFQREKRAFIAVDENGNLLRDGGMSSWGTTGIYETQSDGTCVVEYEISHRELFSLPESATICLTTTDALGYGNTYDTSGCIVLPIL